MHQVQQRKSQQWRRFGYPVLIDRDVDDFTSPFTPLFAFWLRIYIKHSRQCFIGYPNTLNFVKNTPLSVVFSTLFSVFGYPDETQSLVFDTLLLVTDNIRFSYSRSQFTAKSSVAPRLLGRNCKLFKFPLSLNYLFSNCP